MNDIIGTIFLLKNQRPIIKRDMFLKRLSLPCFLA